jgi:RNA polymerase sigma-70 factor (ECF subfamily)
MTGDPESSRRRWVRAALERFEGPLVRYAARLTGDLDRARDVVQETFLRLCEARRDEVEDHLAQWLFTVCRNRALDVQRKEGRMKPLGGVTLQASSNGHGDPPALLERQESLGRVLDVLATLPARQQEVLRLRFQDSLSYKEIAGVTGHSVTNVGFLIHTGLQAIRKKLNPEHRTEITSRDRKGAPPPSAR